MGDNSPTQIYHLQVNAYAKIPAQLNHKSVGKNFSGNFRLFWPHLQAIFHGPDP